MGPPAAARPISPMCSRRARKRAAAAARPTSTQASPAALIEGYRACVLDEAPPVPERPLLHLFNALAEKGGHLLIVSRLPPARWGLELPDLASRLSALPAVRIDPPDDSLVEALLVKLFADRQIAVAPGVVRLSDGAARAQLRCAAAGGRPSRPRIPGPASARQPAAGARDRRAGRGRDGADRRRCCGRINGSRTSSWRRRCSSPRRALSLGPVGRVVLGIACFSALASAIYVLNDWCDRDERPPASAEAPASARRRHGRAGPGPAAWPSASPSPASPSPSCCCRCAFAQVLVGYAGAQSRLFLRAEADRPSSTCC